MVAGAEDAMDNQQQGNGRERLVSALRELSFTTPKQLRHAAEGAGFDFVPTEVVELGEHAAELVLRADDLPPVRVFARRDQPWHPYHVTDVRLEPAQ
jgi:hypothetical protein